jgi:hypothetical protein
MKVVMVMVTRNEAELLQSNLIYHLASGVDQMLVADNGSSDETREILGTFARDGSVVASCIEDDTFRQGEWTTRLAQLAKTVHSADWVLHGDTDEFWWTDNGDIRSVLRGVPAAYGKVLALRHNFVAVRGTHTTVQEMNLRYQNSLNYLGQPMPPKVAHRASADVVVLDGGHDITASSDLEPFPTSLEVLHFPVRSLSQFQRKAMRGNHFGEDVPPEIGATWRAMYLDQMRGTLGARYDELTVSPDAVQGLLDSGVLVRDSRLQLRLSSLAPRTRGFAGLV